ncbi:MAG: hypothetical protein M3N91_19090, partial [Pseudomonadota bacterium]|nr:hypothetical protein [Pseudomonadota bacterium]
DIVLTSPKPAQASIAVKVEARSGTVAAKVRAAYDPDGDGDDDAAEAIGLIQSAMGALTDAIESLNGAGMDEDGAAAKAAAEIAAKAAVDDAARISASDRGRRLRLAEAEAA